MRPMNKIFTDADEVNTDDEDPGTRTTRHGFNGNSNASDVRRIGTHTQQHNGVS